MDIIDIDDLAAYLGEDVSGARGNLIVSLTNSLITENWPAVTDPAPASVQIVAYAVAARAWRSTPGQGRVESITRTVDDASRTERYSASGDGASDVFLTDAELATLGRTHRAYSMPMWRG